MRVPRSRQHSQRVVHTRSHDVYARGMRIVIRPEPLTAAVDG